MRASPLLVELIACVPRIAREGCGDSREAREFALGIRRHGAAALPLLLPYLEHARPEVRAFAAILLRDGPGVDPSDLPALMRAMRRGNYEVAPAIARVGTPQAIRFLVETLRRGGGYQGPLYSALSQLGIKALPYSTSSAKNRSTSAQLLWNTLGRRVVAF